MLGAALFNPILNWILNPKLRFRNESIEKNLRGKLY